MCGIVGFTGSPANREQVLKEMMDAIAHRGPDGEGSYFGSSVALGHRRLSLLDLSSGGQPMFNEDNTIVVIFNGEIYNFQELRSELVELGHTYGVEPSI